MEHQMKGRPGPEDLDPARFPEAGDPRQRLLFLLRYAVLAPSAYNAQPWRFRVTEDAVEIHADPERWLALADPQRRDLHISLGCALENLRLAAARFGYWQAVRYFPEPEHSTLAAVLALGPGGPAEPGDETLFQAIPVRHTSHVVFDGRVPSREHLERLQACDEHADLSLDLLDGAAAVPVVEELAVRADTMVFHDPQRRQELARVLGPEMLGRGWLRSRLGRWVLRHLDVGRSVAGADLRRLSGAPVIGVIAARPGSPEQQLRVGQLFERLALTATGLGLRVQPLSALLGFPELVQDLRELLPAGSGAPQHVFRLGYGDPEVRSSPRRPVADVLLD